MFPKSIRWRIQLWHGALLIVLVATLTAGFYNYEKRSRLQAVDQRLQEYLTPLLPRVTRLAEGRGPGERPPARERPPRFEDGRPMGPPGGPERRPGPPDRPADGMDDYLRLEGQLIYHVAWNREGKETTRSTNAPPEVPPAGDEDPGQQFYRTRNRFREFLHLVPNGDTVVVGMNIAPINTELQRLAIQLTGAGILVAILGIAGGWWLANRAIHPIAQISATAENISGGNLSERINVQDTESELGELARTLNRTFERLEQNFEQQARFTADASHELRTPIAVVLAETQRALLRERTPEEYRQALAVCERGGERMRALVESLLELARIDSGEFAINPEECDLARIGRETIEFIKPFARQKKAVVRDSLESVKASVDPLKFGQVLNNLLTNAIVHNREGVEISVTLTRQDDHAVFTIADNGTGIPPEARPHLFERFYRVDKSRARAQGGSGLGLSICKAIVEAHGGSVSVESEVGEGTRAVVKLLAKEG